MRPSAAVTLQGGWAKDADLTYDEKEGYLLMETDSIYIYLTSQMITTI